jgi:hypothetical protein
MAASSSLGTGYWIPEGKLRERNRLHKSKRRPGSP